MSSVINPTAFPIPGLQCDSDFNGMSLRDYFAAKAMHGFTTQEADQFDSMESLARTAYRVADAMLVVRAK